MSNPRQQNSWPVHASAGRPRQHPNNPGGYGRFNNPHSNNRPVGPHQRGASSLPFLNHRERTKGHQTTCWSYYHEGNVVIPEICVYSIDKRCAYEDKGCLRLHAKCTTQWQVLKDRNWYNFRNIHSREIEDAYEDVTKDKVRITVLDPKKMGKSAQGMIKILGTEQWEADFETMTLRSAIFKGSLSGSMAIRRLSTQSTAVSKSAKATAYEWFFLDANMRWIRYGEGDSVGKAHLIVSMTSDEIEQKFCLDPTASLVFNNTTYKYQLDFTAMKQRNLDTGKERPVRRRPLKKNPQKPSERANDKDLPPHWDKMKDQDTMVQVTLDMSSQEYLDVISQVHLTLPDAEVLTVKRIQNPFLWRPFKIKQTKLAIQYGGVKFLNIQKLFHGTKAENLSKISQENLDWRLYGLNVGNVYGEGAYFSNSAPVALKYAPRDSQGHRFLLLAEVIVGKVTKGNQTMSRPPANPTTGELYDTTVDSVTAPKIFVKYDIQEYYPHYIIELL